MASDNNRDGRTARGRACLRGSRVVVVASQFNESITQALVNGALGALTGCGVLRANIRVFWVPGAFELPVAAASVARALRPDAVIALGCVLKGETPQYLAIGQAAAAGLAQVSVSTRIPVAFGVIIADSLKQAKQRSRGRIGNRGSEAALAALEMVNLLKKLPQRSRGGRQ